jgi:hypothetical protein
MRKVNFFFILSYLCEFMSKCMLGYLELAESS